jgi:hypothetical protein
MAEQPTREERERWERWFAVECNNAAWGLAAKEGREAEEEREMLWLAYAAALHWSKAGTPLHVARAELLLAHVHALRGEGETALRSARSCLAFFEGNPGEDWDLAFAHAEMAHAAAAAGDPALHARHHALARERGEAIRDPEDRRVFLEEFARIPAPPS